MDEVENSFCNTNTKEVTPHTPGGEEKKTEKPNSNNRIFKLGSLFRFSKNYNHASEILWVWFQTTAIK